MGLQGTIDTLPVLDALEALGRLRREGLLEVRGGGSRGTLSIVDGALVAGEVDGLVGPVGDREALVRRLVDVLATFARLEQGGFDFRLGRVEAPHGPRVELAEVLDRARAAAAAWSPVAGTVPGFDSVVHLVETSDDAPLTVSRSALRLVALVDGRRDVAALGEALGCSAAETIAPLAGLVARGVVEIGPAPSAPSQVPATHATPAAPDPIVEEVAREQAALAARLAETHRTSEVGPAARALADLADLAGLPAPEPPEASGTEISEDAERLVAMAATPEPGDGPTIPAGAPDPGQTTITADRGALLRLFSGLRSDQA